MDNKEWKNYSGDVFPVICLMCNKRTRDFYELTVYNPICELIVCSTCYTNESFSMASLISAIESYYQSIVNNMKQK